MIRNKIKKNNKKLKTTRKRNCGVLQGGNHYDRTTQHYINER